LRTADAGYLTRRLVDVAQDLIINEEDCGTQEGIWINASDDVAGQKMETRLFGRVSAERILDPMTGEVLVERDDIFDRERIKTVLAAKITSFKVRSALTCELTHGICAKCYGLDMGRGKMVELGQAVGVIAAESIGEPGTQLTLRTFHMGGVAASAGDITTGLPRVVELFEARRAPKGEAVVTAISGIARVMEGERTTDVRVVRVESAEMIADAYEVPESWEILVQDEGSAAVGDILAQSGDATIVAQHTGRVRLEGRQVVVSYERKESEEYDIPSNARLLVRDGDQVEAGQALTEGSLNPHTILRIKGKEAVEMYLLTEAQKVYRAQGPTIADKHFEVIIRKMVGKVQITRPGDTPYLPMDIVDRLAIRKINENLVAEGKAPAKFVPILLGVSKASLNTESFLSMSSFQHTIKVLAGAAIGSSKDPLYGLKENVIIGKLIPAGTGFVHGVFDDEEPFVAPPLVNLPTGE
jgi:DNA-directed RNA polymerase subunit beta'